MLFYIKLQFAYCTYAEVIILKNIEVYNRVLTKLFYKFYLIPVLAFREKKSYIIPLEFLEGISLYIFFYMMNKHSYI